MSDSPLENKKPHERAHWQRTEGMVLFREVSEVIFPLVGSNPGKKPWIFDSHYPLNSLARLGHLFKDTADTAITELHATLPPPLQETRNMTYFSTVKQTMQEASESAAFIPLNVLYELHLQEPALRLQTAEDVVDGLRSGQLKKLVHEGAVAANGFWGIRGQRMLPRPELPYVHNDGAPYSLIEIDSSGPTPTYTFTDVALRSMRGGMQQANALSLSDRRQKRRYGSEFMGTTAGCPARFHEPSKPSPSDDVLTLIGETFGKTRAQLLERRDHTAIDLGLDALADLAANASRLHTDT